MHTFISYSENETMQFANLLAPLLDTGDVVVLSGNLGLRKN